MKKGRIFGVVMVLFVFVFLIFQNCVPAGTTTRIGSSQNVSAQAKEGLKELSFSSGVLEPAFSESVTDYTLSTETEFVTLTALPFSATDKITVDGESLDLDHQFEAEIDPDVGRKEVMIKVVSENQEENTYHVTFLYTPPAEEKIVDEAELKGRASNSVKIGIWNTEGDKDFSDKLKAFRSSQLGAADVICLQETKVAKVSQIAAKLGYYSFSYGTNAIVTRFPITDSGKVTVNTDTGRTATWATLNVNGRELRVYSPHLSYKIDSNPFIGKIRRTEMKNIVTHAKQFSGPSIIGGDMNTVGFLVGGHTKEPLVTYAKDEGYKDATAKCPKYTQKAGGVFPMGKIDWIFSKNLKVNNCKTGHFSGSDHRWMMAHLIFQ